MGEYAMVYFRHTTFALNLTEHATQLLVQALVLSRLDYCNALLAGLLACSVKPLQLIQNVASQNCIGCQLQLALNSRL